MLNYFNAFLNRISVKSIPYLLNPRVVSEQESFFFKGMILHYLNTDNEELFISRTSRYFKDIPLNKKIVIFHLEDLLYKEDTINLKNKYLKRDIKQWNLKNIKQFRYFDFVENGISDENTIHVINYNTIKDLYNYKSSLLAEYNKFNNLYLTVMDNVKICLNKFKENKNLLNIKIPLAIPNYFLIDKLIEFNNIKYTRIIKNNHLKVIIELYKWLSDKTRERSIFKNITDDDSVNLILEFEYKNHYCYIPMSLLRSLSKESSLESKLKLEPSKLNRLFIFTLLRIQKIVDGELNNIENIETKEEDKEESKDVFKEEHDDEDLVDNEEDATPSDVLVDNVPDQLVKTKNKELDIKKLDNINNFNFEDKEDDIKKFLSNLDKELEENKEVDDIFIEDMLLSEKEDNKNIDENKKEIFTIETDETKLVNLVKDKTSEEKYEHFLEKNKEFKLLSSADIRNLKKIKEQRSNIKSPYDNKYTYDDYAIPNEKDKEIREEDKKIASSVKIVDEDLKYENIRTLDRKYIKENLKRDIISCIRKIEDSEIIIKDHKVEIERSLQGNYEKHSLTLKPYLGKESTIYFRLPVIDEDGTFLISGVKCLMRKQKADLPIRKISPTKVSLVSNYCKLFISRTERKAFNYYEYITNYIKNDYLTEKKVITKLQPENSFNNYLNTPALLSYLSKSFNNFETNEYRIETNYTEAKNRLEEKFITSSESKGYFYFGYNKKTKEPLFINNNEDIFIYKNNNYSYIGTIENILNIENEKIPVDFSTIKLLGKEIPLGIILAYYLGLNNLIAVTKAKVTFIESNKRYTPATNEYVIRFNDYKLIVNKKDKEASLLLGGFLFFKDFIKNYNISDFNEKNIYLSLLEYRDFNMLHIKEADLLRDLFLDPITVDVLKDINEPHEYIPLLLRANQLLINFTHPDKNDANYFRIRNYERIPGLMYRAIVESIRDYKFKYNSKGKVDLDPYKVWNNITKDNTTKITEDINPIMDLKEHENITFGGIDGIDKEAFPLELRKYHKNDIGFISEATVDNADVAMTAYLTPYTKIKNTRGLVDKDKKVDKHEIFSTSTLLTPYSTHDDPKRINFINIQNSHTIATKGYVQPAIRTEYEYLLPYRTTKMFSYVAEEDGIVLDKTDKKITIQYKDSNRVVSLRIGKVYGRAEGTVYEHILVSDLNKNDKFKKDDIIYYNSNFFERDWVSNNIILKMNKLYTVALMMTNEVFEDSSAISKKLSKEMTTVITKEYSFIIEFSKNIINILPEGTEVEPNTTLFIVLEEGSNYTNLSENTLLLLQNLTNFAPKAKLKGILERYEVRYNGDISDMSPTLKKFVSRIEKQMIEENKGTEYEITSCQVDHEYRVEGKNLLPDTLELKVFISFDVEAAIGDKGVFSSQLKSVISEVYSNKVIAEQTKDEIDAFFSYNSIANRITLSPLITGILNRLLRIQGKKIVEENM